MYPLWDPIGLTVGSSTVIGVSSVWTLRDAIADRRIASTIGDNTEATYATQPHIVDREIFTPTRPQICC
jgi:hypothetical protein